MNTIHLEVAEKLLIGVVAVAGQQLVSSMYKGLMDSLHINKIRHVKFMTNNDNGYEVVKSGFDVKFIAILSSGDVKIVYKNKIVRVISNNIILET
jgi:hypothetical protein